MYMRKSKGPVMKPCGTQFLTPVCEPNGQSLVNVVGSVHGGSSRLWQCADVVTMYIRLQGANASPILFCV
jgi:hypothetical protein